jgi:membrane associated rhomboid family serine protease
MIRKGIVVAVLAACAYMFVLPQDTAAPFHYSSKPSSDNRTPFFSHSVDASSSLSNRRLHISVDIKNPTGAFFALCVVPPGQKLPSYQRKRACGGVQAFQMQTSEHEAMQRGIVLDDAAIVLDWYSNSSHAESGKYSVVFELHNTVLPARFDAVVATSMFYDFGGNVDGALYYPLQALRSSLKSFSNAYSFVRPASCKAAANSPLVQNVVGSCTSFLAPLHSSLLVMCRAVSAGHVALALIVLLNLLFFFPSIEHQDWWALKTRRPSLRQLFSYQFAHADGQHILGNMMTLMFVGTEVSESLNCDHILFISFYLLCGVAGGLLALLLSPKYTTTVGASGSVSGIIVALSVLRPNSAVAILGDVNASNPLMLLVGTLLADLKRLGVSWQVLPVPTRQFPLNLL